MPIIAQSVRCVKPAPTALASAVRWALQKSNLDLDDTPLRHHSDCFSPQPGV
jgi:hypothetical protein